jgi:hypothetical protein
MPIISCSNKQVYDLALDLLARDDYACFRKTLVSIMTGVIRFRQKVGGKGVFGININRSDRILCTICNNKAGDDYTVRIFDIILNHNYPKNLVPPANSDDRFVLKDLLKEEPAAAPGVADVSEEVGNTFAIDYLFPSIGIVIFSGEQQEVIATSNTCIITGNAGTGKTLVLLEKFLLTVSQLSSRELSSPVYYLAPDNAQISNAQKIFAKMLDMYKMTYNFADDVSEIVQKAKFSTVAELVRLVQMNAQADALPTFIGDFCLIDESQNCSCVELSYIRDRFSSFVLVYSGMQQTIVSDTTIDLKWLKKTFNVKKELQLHTNYRNPECVRTMMENLHKIRKKLLENEKIRLDPQVYSTASDNPGLFRIVISQDSCEGLVDSLMPFVRDEENLPCRIFISRKGTLENLRQTTRNLNNTNIVMDASMYTYEQVVGVEADIVLVDLRARENAGLLSLLFSNDAVASPKNPDYITMMLNQFGVAITRARKEVVLILDEASIQKYLREKKLTQIEKDFPKNIQQLTLFANINVTYGCTDVVPNGKFDIKKWRDFFETLNTSTSDVTLLISRLGNLQENFARVIGKPLKAEIADKPEIAAAVNALMSNIQERIDELKNSQKASTPAPVNKKVLQSSPTVAPSVNETILDQLNKCEKIEEAVDAIGNTFNSPSAKIDQLLPKIMELELIRKNNLTLCESLLCKFAASGNGNAWFMPFLTYPVNAGTADDFNETMPLVNFFIISGKKYDFFHVLFANNYIILQQNYEKNKALFRWKLPFHNWLLSTIHDACATKPMNKIFAFLCTYIEKKIFVTKGYNDIICMNENVSSLFPSETSLIRMFDMWIFSLVPYNDASSHMFVHLVKQKLPQIVAEFGVMSGETLFAKIIANSGLIKFLEGNHEWYEGFQMKEYESCWKQEICVIHVGIMTKSFQDNKNRLPRIVRLCLDAFFSRFLQHNNNLSVELESMKIIESMFLSIIHCHDYQCSSEQAMYGYDSALENRFFKDGNVLNILTGIVYQERIQDASILLILKVVLFHHNDLLSSKEALNLVLACFVLYRGSNRFEFLGDIEKYNIHELICGSSRDEFSYVKSKILNFLSFIYDFGIEAPTECQAFFMRNYLFEIAFFNQHLHPNLAYYLQNFNLLDYDNCVTKAAHSFVIRKIFTKKIQLIFTLANKGSSLSHCKAINEKNTEFDVAEAMIKDFSVAPNCKDLINAVSLFYANIVGCDYLKNLDSKEQVTKSKIFIELLIGTLAGRLLLKNEHFFTGILMLRHIIKQKNSAKQIKYKFVEETIRSFLTNIHCRIPFLDLCFATSSINTTSLFEKIAPELQEECWSLLLEEIPFSDGKDTVVCNTFFVYGMSTFYEYLETMLQQLLKRINSNKLISLNIEKTIANLLIYKGKISFFMSACCNFVAQTPALEQWALKMYQLVLDQKKVVFDPKQLQMFKSFGIEAPRKRIFINEWLSFLDRLNVEQLEKTQGFFQVLKRRQIDEDITFALSRIQEELEKRQESCVSQGATSLSPKP